MENKTVSNTTPTAIFNACSSLGVNMETLSSRVRIRRDTLTNASERSAFKDVIQLWRESYRLTEDRFIGVRAAETLQFGAFKVIDYMMAASETPKDGLKKALKYYPLINEGFDLTLILDNSFGYVKLCNPGDPKNMPFQYVDFVFACVLNRVRFSTFPGWQPHTVELTCSKPVDSKSYYDLFGAPIKFQSKENRLILQRNGIEIPQANSDPYLCEMLDTHARRMIDRLPSKNDVLSELSDILRKNLGLGEYGLGKSAKTMGLSSRSLQRSLKNKGISYRQLLNEIRLEVATDLLKQNNRSIEEISFMLGFSEKSSFYRAFKHWTGTTPSEFIQTETDPTKNLRREVGVFNLANEQA